MFAPLIAKPQAKTAGQSSDKSALRRAAASDHDWDIEQAQTSRRVPQTGPRFAGNEPPGGAWDFSKIPLYPHGQTDGPERPSPAPVPRLPGPIQRKLTVGQVDDPLEHEADRVADQVMRMPAPDVAMASAPLQVSRKCVACEGEEKLQKKEAAPAAPAVSEAPVSVHDALRSPGEPLDPATRAYFEPRFGRDFGDVRVHTGAQATESARDVNAHAYTVGRDIAFDSGRFAPGSQDGRRLLAHELTHVAQQSHMRGDQVRESRGGERPPLVSTMDELSLQRGPGDQPPAADGPVLGASKPAPDDVILFHYGNLEARGEMDAKTVAGAPFKSTPDYPRLTDYDIAYDPESSGTLRAPAAAVAKNTGTPVRPALRFKYELRINKAYFEKNFREGGGRGAYSEYGYKDPIPIKYFRRVSEIAPTGVEPSARTASGSLTAKGPSSGPGGGSLDTADNESTKTSSTAPRVEGTAPDQGEGAHEGPPSRSSGVLNFTTGIIVNAAIVALGMLVQSWNYKNLFRSELERLQPQIETELQKVAGQAARLQAAGKTPYANVTVSVLEHHTVSQGGSYSARDIHDDAVPLLTLSHVEFSEDDINSFGTRTVKSLDTQFGSPTYGYRTPYTYSFPKTVSDQAAELFRKYDAEKDPAAKASLRAKIIETFGKDVETNTLDASMWPHFDFVTNSSALREGRDVWLFTSEQPDVVIRRVAQAEKLRLIRLLWAGHVYDEDIDAIGVIWKNSSPEAKAAIRAEIDPSDLSDDDNRAKLEVILSR